MGRNIECIHSNIPSVCSVGFLVCSVSHIIYNNTMYLPRDNISIQYFITRWYDADIQKVDEVKVGWDDDTCTFILKLCYKKSYHNDVKYHMT